jgi:hypothetical protein
MMEFNTRLNSQIIVWLEYVKMQILVGQKLSFMAVAWKKLVRVKCNDGIMWYSADILVKSLLIVDITVVSFIFAGTNFHAEAKNNIIVWA